MTQEDFLRIVRLNPVNAALLDRLPELGTSQTHLVAGALFQTVWNVLSGQPPGDHLRDYDLFYWDADTSYEAEDAVIRRADTLFADLGARIEVRNQARVHLWFPGKHGLHRPPLHSAREGIDQFLVECTCVGIGVGSDLYAPFGLDDLAAGRLRRNPRNHTPGLYAAKVADYQARWPWLREVEEG
ncbi:hypothetical protein DAETH_23930 [Deinococcus aetherius]|uniref:Nucleotidyltransferase family protein n=1 Tax=Deinococcus aetherius TaxID=200252 RepID=A0ABM8AF48_9DEIO|nr:nucleotidyltransferase family protein [Deinococcus aetherius]BDP42424.1 hypothetical protein DAETH_23930 [Deinococcus aetherius]